MRRSAKKYLSGALALEVHNTMDPWPTLRIAEARISNQRLNPVRFKGAFGELDLGNSHGGNERLPVDTYYESIEFMYRLVKKLTQ